MLRLVGGGVKILPRVLQCSTGREIKRTSPVFAVASRWNDAKDARHAGLIPASSSSMGALATSRAANAEVTITA